MSLIGILTDHPYPLPRSFARVCRIAERLETPVIYFLPGGTDWKSERVFAIKWIGENWKRDWSPLPSLVVNQVRYRHIEASHLCQNDVAAFQKRSIPVWNPSLFHKRLMHECLNSSDRSLYVPESLSAHQPIQELRSFVEQKTSVLTKPVYSSSGRGILKITCKDSVYDVNGVSMGGRPVSRERLTWEELQSFQRDHYGNVEWFWQEEIQFSRHSSRPAEWHALLGRDRDAGWQLTGVYPLRRSGTPITKLGSSLTTWVPPIRDSSLLATANQLSECLGPLSEVTLDLAISSKEIPVLLDASPRVLRHLYPEKVRQAITARLVQFLAREVEKLTAP